MGDYENLSRRDRLISLVYREQSRGTLVVSALCLPSSLQTIGIVQTSSLQVTISRSNSSTIDSHDWYVECENN
jgi:hypothetical protein